MKKIVLCILSSLLLGTGMAQSFDDEDLQRRYFLSRDRLKKWFVTANSDPGGGIPVENFQIFQEKFSYPFDRVILKADKTDSVINNTNWLANQSVNNGNTEASGTMNCDNPLIMLGEYLSVLSTEYWLMKHYGLQGSEDFLAIKNEMYYALQAIDRLDGTAEPYFKEFEKINYNGFLRREDSNFDRITRVNSYYRVKEGYLQGYIQQADMNNIEGPAPDTGFLVQEQYEKFITSIRLRDSTVFDSTLVNGNWVIDTSVIGIYKDSFETITTGLYHKYYRNNYRISRPITADPAREDKFYNKCNGRFENEMSMDELIGLMSGLRYVQKFVDEDVTAKPFFDDSLKSLVPWTRVIADRLMLHLSSQTTNIRYLQPADYVKNQQLAALKDRKGMKAFRRVRDGESDFDTECKDCLEYEIYSQYTAQNGKVYNPVLFKTGNYVLTNPAANGRPVARGPFAFTYGAGLERLGERLASSSGNNKDYPGVSMELDDEEEIARLLSFIGGSQLVYSIALPAALIYWPIDEVAVNNSTFLDNITLEMTGRCVGLNTGGIDATSLCLTGSLFRPGQPWWWRIVWDKIGDSSTVINKLWLKYANESGSPNVMAAKIAACNGDWDNGNFAHFAEKCGFPMMSLQYDILNDKTPVLSKSYFQELLNTMDCLGAKGESWPFDRDVLGGHAMKPSLKNTNNSNDGRFHANTGFMLYYNLYRIANIQYWGNDVSNYTNNACPCFIDSFSERRKLYSTALEPSRKAYLKTNSSGQDYYDIYISYNYNKKQLGNLVKTKDANPSHAKISVRQPEFLNHYYELGANQKFGISRDLVVCNAQLNVKNGGEVFIDTSSNYTSPNELIIRKNGELVLNTNTILRVNPYSRTVIEIGGKITYHPGARIILNGPNAVLHIKGKLELAAGAEFKIEGGPAGKGYIIWDNGAGSPHYGLATLEAGAGSSMLIEQANPNVLGLKVEGSIGMVTPFSLAKLKIQNCRVALGPASQLVSQADSTIVHNVQVKGYFGPHANAEFNFKATAKGLHQLGKRNSYNMVTISECAIGLTVFNLGTSEALNMQDVYFENCLTAIHNRGGRLRYKDGNIRAVSLGGAYMDLRNGIYGEGTQGASMLENVELSARHFPNPVYHPLGAMEQTHNLKVHGAGNYYFYKSKIQFADYGSKMDQAGLLPVCTEIFDNTTQLQHTTWSKFVAVNQAWNHIHWPTSPAPTNPKKMYFGYMSYLYLDKGQNQIMGYTSGMPYLQALLASDQNLIVSTDPLKWNTSAINATQNQWQTTPETQPSVNYNAIVEHGFPVANTIDINKLPLNTSNWQSTQANYCMNLKTPFSPVLGDGETESDTGIYGNGVGNGERRMPVSPADLGTMLSQHGHNGAAYVQSLRRVLRAMDMRPPNYGAIIDTFRQLLTQPLPDTVSAAVKHVYGLLQDFYLEVRTDKFIPEQDRVAQEQMVFAKMLALQQQLLVLSTDTNSIWHTPRFELTRDKALLYRVFNQRTEAIAFLDSKIPAWQPLYEKEALEVWKCILQWEQSYIDNQVSYNEFIQYSCAESWAAGANNGTGSKGSISKSIGEATKEESQLRSNGIPEKTGNTEIADKNNFTLYPNPAENSFTVASNSGITRVRVYETNGRLLLDLTQTGQTAVEINIETLVRGTYIVAAETPIKTYRRTLVVNR